MRYGIMINLDYDTHPYEECRDIWLDIRNAMVEGGFRIEGRLFTIEMPVEDAGKLACSIMEEVNKNVITDRDLFDFLKEFYGYDHTQTVNLLLPPTDNIDLLED